MNAVSGRSLWQLSAWLSISTRGWAIAKVSLSQFLFPGTYQPEDTLTASAPEQAPPMLILVVAQLISS